MPSCVMRKCTNYGSKINKLHGITYHKFPCNELLRQEWIAIVRMQRSEHDWLPTKCSTICSVHFSSNYKYTSGKGRTLLKEGAVPVLKGSFEVASSSCSKPFVKKRKLDDDDSECDDNDSDIEDEYDLWAKECAVELRQMDLEQQILAKRAITYILMEGRLGLLNSNSVQVNNKVPGEETDHEDLNVSVLDEFLVIHNESNSVAVSQEIGTSSGSSPSLVDTELSLRAASRKTVPHPSRVRSKPSKKTTVSASQQTATPVDASTFDNSGSKFIVTSHTTATPAGSSSLVVKTEAFNDPGSSSVIGSHKIAASEDSTSAFVKLEPFDDTGPNTGELTTPVDSSTFIVKVEPCDDPLGSISLSCASPVRRSSHRMSEPNSPPSSPDFLTVVIKKEHEQE